MLVRCFPQKAEHWSQLPAVPSRWTGPLRAVDCRAAASLHVQVRCGCKHVTLSLICKGQILWTLHVCVIVIPVMRICLYVDSWHANQLTLTALSTVVQQWHSSMTTLFCYFPLVAAKHTAQHSTSQPPVKSPGETGDGVVLLHLVFPFFVVFIVVYSVPPLMSCYSLHCAAAAAFVVWPSPPAEETQLSLTMHKRTRRPYTTCTRWIDLKIFLEVKLHSTQEWLTVRLEHNQTLT